MGLGGFWGGRGATLNERQAVGHGIDQDSWLWCADWLKCEGQLHFLLWDFSLFDLVWRFFFWICLDFLFGLNSNPTIVFSKDT